MQKYWLQTIPSQAIMEIHTGAVQTPNALQFIERAKEW